MRALALLVGLPFALIVGLQFGWRWVLAPVLGYAIWAWARASLRSMASGSATGEPVDTGEPTPVGAGERTMYWCEECGTEVLLLVRGAGTPPRHCGTRMHERTEILN